MLTVGSLFTGIGGFDLGLARAGMRTLWVCEQDPFCQFVLRRRFPDATRYSDVSRLFGPPRPNVLVGGFPCQDISVLGHSHGAYNEGIDGARSGLWSEFARLIRDLRPDYVVVENSPHLTSQGLDRVLCDLAESGYDAEWDCLRAHDFGAPHLRERLFLVAYPGSFRQERPRGQDRLLSAQAWEGRKSRIGDDNWWTEQPEPQRVADGFPYRLDKDFRFRVATTGNALLPQIAEYIGEQIIEDVNCRRSAASHRAHLATLRRENQRTT